MLSRPGALPYLGFVVAASSSSNVKSDDRLASAVAALECEVTSRAVQRAKSLSAFGKRSLSKSCKFMRCYLQLLNTWRASCLCLSDFV